MGSFNKQQSGGTMCRLEINFFDRHRAWVGITAYIFGIRELDIIRFFYVPCQNTVHPWKMRHCQCPLAQCL